MNRDTKKDKHNVHCDCMLGIDSVYRVHQEKTGILCMILYFADHLLYEIKLSCKTLTCTDPPFVFRIDGSLDGIGLRRL